MYDEMECNIGGVYVCTLYIVCVLDIIALCILYVSPLLIYVIVLSKSLYKNII